MIDGSTRLLAIVGDPIEHARTPAAINARLARTSHNVVLVPCHAPAAAFRTVTDGLKQTANLTGIVVTYPFKQQAMALADRVRPTARRTGALNALRREPDGSWTGDMFDGAGLINAALELGRPITGAAVKLLGAGGAGRAIGFALAESGTASIDIYDIDRPRAATLAADLRGEFPDCVATPGEPVLGRADLLINASPVGLARGDGLPIPLDDLSPATVVVDIVPRHDGTELLAFARERGCLQAGGAAMVEGQALALLRFFGLAGTGMEDSAHE